MADNMRWFKVWTTLLTDYISKDISLEDIGRFTLLGCLTAQKGTEGTVIVTDAAKKAYLKCDMMSKKLSLDFDLNTVQRGDGTIIVTFRGWKKYQKDSSGYLRMRRWRKRQQSDGSNSVTSDGDKTKIRQRQDKTKTKTSPYTPQGGVVPFEQFWNIYPKHANKQQAQKAWDKLQPNQELFEKMRTALAWQVLLPDWVKDKGQFIPYGSTYLNQKRWEDERPKEFDNQDDVPNETKETPWTDEEPVNAN